MIFLVDRGGDVALVAHTQTPNPTQLPCILLRLTHTTKSVESAHGKGKARRLRDALRGSEEGKAGHGHPGIRSSPGPGGESLEKARCLGSCSRSRPHAAVAGELVLAPHAQLDGAGQEAILVLVHAVNVGLCGVCEGEGVERGWDSRGRWIVRGKGEGGALLEKGPHTVNAPAVS
jgi:hypothetical protein